MVQFKDQTHVQPPPGSTTRFWPQITRLAFVAIAYWLTVRIGLLFVAQPEGIASIWPVSGLALAVLLLNPKDQWGKLLAVIFATNTIGNWSSGNSLSVSLGFALANTLETSLGAWTMAYFCKSKITFGHAAEIFALFGVAIFGNGVTALLGAAVPMLAFGAPFLNTWLLWWAADGLGIILVTPVIVTWVTRQNVLHSISPRRLVETVLLALVLVMFAWLLFGSFTVAEKPLLRNYMLFPLLIWVAFRYSPRGMAGTLLLFAAIATWNTLQGNGIFAFTEQTQTEHLVFLQMFLIVAAFSGLLLSTMVTESKQAKEALHASEARYRTLIEQIPAIVYIDDATGDPGHSLYVSPQIETLLGITPDEWLQEDLDLWANHIHPDDRKQAIAGYLRGFKNGEKIDIEYRMVTADSRLVWIRDQTMMIRDGDGRPRLIHGVMYDITERKQAEEKLRESEERFRALIEHSHDAITLLTADGTVIYDSPSIIGILGYSPTERTGRRVFEFVHPEEREGMVHGFAKFAQQMGAVALSEARFIHKDGTPRWIEGVRTNLLHEPLIRAVVVNYRDITERRQAEEVLRIAEANYRAIFENAPIGIFQSTPQGRFRSVNPAMAHIYGYDSPEDMIASITDIAHQLYVDSSNRQKFQRLLAEYGEVVDFIGENYCKDGSIIWTQTTARTEKDAYGKILYYEGFLIDITERKQAEEALRESEEKMRSIFRVVPTGIGVVRDRVLLEVNPRICEMTGYAKEELVGQSARVLYPTQEDFDFVGREKYKQIAEKGSGAVETRWQKKDGSIIDIILASTPIDPADLSRGVTFTALDITDHKRAEEKLATSEAELRALFAAMTDVVIVYDADGRYIKIAPTNPINLYRPLDDMLGKTVHDILPKEQADYMVTKIGEAIKTSQVVTCEYALQIGGKEIWFAGNASRLSENTAVWVAHDITNRKHAEEALRQAEAKYRDIFENALEGIFQTTPAGTFLTANPALARMLGYDSPEELIANVNNLNQDFYVQPARREEFMKQLSDHGMISNFESEVHRKDGSTIWISENAQAVCDDVGQVLYYEGTLENVTERKQAEDKLRHRTEELTALLKSSQSLAATLNLGVVLQATTDSITELIGLQSAAIYLLEGEMLYLGATSPALPPQFTEELRHALLTDHPHICQAVTTALPVFLPDTATADLTPAEQAVSEVRGLRSILYLPLLAGAKVTGTLIVASIGKPKVLAETEIDLCSTLANLAALAVENARLYEQAQQEITERKRAEDEILEKSQELEALFAISSHLRTAQTANDMLPVVLEQMSKVLNADANAVVFLNPNQTRFTYAIGNGLLTPNTGLQFAAENSISGRTLQTRQPYVTLDYTNDPLRSGAIRNSGRIGPMVAVPLQSETEFIGTLLCARSKDSPTEPFSSAEVKLLVSIGEMVGNALRRARLYDDALLRLQRVQGLRSIDSFISANMDIKITLKLIVGQTLSLMNVEAAAILLYNPNLHMLEYATAQGFHHKDIEKARFELGNAFSEKAILERRIITASDLSSIQDPAHKEMMQKEGFVACYVTPMIAKGKVLGVLELYNRTPFHSDQEWLDFLEALGGQAAIAIDNAHLFRDLQTSNLELTLAYDATIQGWSQALDLKDRETEGHTLRVTEATIGIAKLAGLSEDKIMHIRRGALLHDIGKMGIPDHILNKTGKLTPKEWDIIRQHPQYAYNMLHPIEFLRPALDIPYSHHEKWDGTGYPQGLKNIQIPYAARLFAVVDVWDALTNNRIYRKAWPKKKVFAYIQGQSGKYFDPQVVGLFLKYVDTIASRKR